MGKFHYLGTSVIECKEYRFKLEKNNFNSLIKTLDSIESYDDKRRLLKSLFALHVINESQALELLKYLKIFDIDMLLSSIRGKISNDFIKIVFSPDRYTGEIDETENFYDILSCLDYFATNAEKIFGIFKPNSKTDKIEILESIILPSLDEILNRLYSFYEKFKSTIDDLEISLSKEKFIKDNYSLIFKRSLNIKDDIPLAFIKKYKDQLSFNFLYDWWRFNISKYPIEEMDNFKDFIIKCTKAECEEVLYRRLPVKQGTIPGLEITIKWDMYQTTLFDEIDRDRDNCEEACEPVGW